MCQVIVQLQLPFLQKMDNKVCVWIPLSKYQCVTWMTILIMDSFRSINLNLLHTYSFTEHFMALKNEKCKCNWHCGNNNLVLWIFILPYMHIIDLFHCRNFEWSWQENYRCIWWFVKYKVKIFKCNTPGVEYQEVS